MIYGICFNPGEQAKAKLCLTSAAAARAAKRPADFCPAAAEAGPQTIYPAVYCTANLMPRSFMWGIYLCDLKWVLAKCG